MEEYEDKMPDEIYVIYDGRNGVTDFDATTEPDKYMNLTIRYVKA